MKKEFVIFIVLIALISLTAAQNISIELNWDEDDIHYEKEFDIEINIYNLQNQTYDLKIWIQPENSNTALTEIYDSETNKWKSGNYYINNFFEGSGNFSDIVELRIKEKYKNYKGSAYLYARLRDGFEIKKEIEVLKPKEPEPPPKPPPESESIQEQEQPTTQAEPPESSIIQLSKPISQTYNSTAQQETIKTNNPIYESKNQLIIKYSTFSFALLCVILSILISWRKLE